MFNKSVKFIFLLIMLMIVTTIGALAFAPESAWVTINDNSDRIMYEGMWNSLKFAESYGETEIAAHHRSSAEFVFEGSAVRWIGSLGKRNGLAEVYIDGKLDGVVDCYGNGTKFQQIIYEKDGLTEGEHTIKVVATGKKSNQSLSSFIMLDAFAYLPSLTDSLNLTKDIINNSVIGKPVQGEKLESYYPLEAVKEAKKAVEDAEFVNRIDNISGTLKISTIAYLNDARKDLENSLVDKLVFFDMTKQGADALVHSGSPRWIKGKLNGAIELDGKKDRLIVAHKDYLSPTEAITVEAWINADSWKNNTWEGVVLGKDGDRGGNTGYTLRTGNNGTVEFVVTTPSWTAAASDPVLETGRWYHVAGVFDSRTIKLYIDGKLQATTSVAQPYNFSTFDLFIGDCAAWQGRIFDGKIDDVRIWNTARSAEEIKNNYKQELGGNEKGLIAYWDFNNLY